MNRKKVIITILVILFIVLMGFIVNVIAKMIIIKDINDKVSEYRNSKHYYLKKIAHFDNEEMVIEHYSKGDNAVTFNTEYTDDTNLERTIIDYYKGNQNNRYVDSKANGKTAILNINKLSEKIQIRDLDYGNDFGTLLNLALTTPITEVNYKEKECYFIDSDKFEHPYIDKETGLTLRTSYYPIDKINERQDAVSEYEYKFEDFDDSVFTEPDISEYIIEEQ